MAWGCRLLCNLSFIFILLNIFVDRTAILWHGGGMNYNIVEQNLNTLLNRIDRLNAKLVRIGAAPVVYKQVGHTDEPHPVEASKLVRYIELEISADTAKANGWEFVATLVHTDDGNIIRSVPGFAVPVEFRDKATWCDHCQTSRLRRDTYIVRHADGRVMQVGSNCLQEFIGQPAGRLARGTDLLLNVYDMCESATKTNWLGGHNGLNTFRIDLDTFLANVAAVVLKDGKYLTRKMATAMGGNEMTTAERGYKATMGQFTCGDEPLYPVTDEAKKMANDARTSPSDRTLQGAQKYATKVLLCIGAGLVTHTVDAPHWMRLGSLHQSI